ncbi:MAG: DNA-directed RNA polymerase subunit A'' [Candidatus Nanohaloarchaeota archaeon]|nr:DNA-directed RNA polymerase subunit A'' [Candidatus Nanohaloarchaeota archaeon]
MAKKSTAKQSKAEVEGSNVLMLPPKYQNLKGKALEEALKRYEKMRYEYGEAVGVVAAQSISEPATQITLRAYHAAGRVQLVTTKGLPRLIEIFDAKKEPKTPSMTIYLEKDYNTAEKAHEIASKIKETSLKDVMEYDAIDLAEMVLEIKLNEEKLKNHFLDVNAVKNALSKSMATAEFEIKDDTTIIAKPKAKHYGIKDLQLMRTKLRDRHVKGIRGIKQILIEKDGEEWKITTLGSNLKKVLDLKGVDKKRTYTNNIFEVAEVLGIEAARNLIIKEALNTLREQGVDTDVRHIMLVADIMTHTGSIQAIGRYGVAGSKASVLARANFEETVKHLTKAAFKGERDMLTSVVENVIIGNAVPVGTGMIKVKYKD